MHPDMEQITLEYIEQARESRDIAMIWNIIMILRLGIAPMTQRDGKPYWMVGVLDYEMENQITGHGRSDYTHPQEKRFERYMREATDAAYASRTWMHGADLITIVCAVAAEFVKNGYRGLPVR